MAGAARPGARAPADRIRRDRSAAARVSRAAAVHPREDGREHRAVPPARIRVDRSWARSRVRPRVHDETPRLVFSIIYMMRQMSLGVWPCRMASALAGEPTPLRIAST